MFHILSFHEVVHFYKDVLTDLALSSTRTTFALNFI